MSGTEGGVDSAGGGITPAAGSDFASVTPALRPGPEFDLIRDFARSARRNSHRAVRVGIGDDCAIVEGGRLALSTDLSVEGVHFRREWLEPEEIGFRAAAAALSDLAAVAAEPIGVLISLAVTAADADAIAREIMAGATAVAESLGGELLGGDVSRSPGPILIDVVAVGSVAGPVLRTGAAPGDEIWVTGRLGGAAAAVHSWLAGHPPSTAARNAFARPTARVREARWLAERADLRAMIDVSDGLGGDVAHLATASGVAAVLEAGLVPIAESVLDLGPSDEQALSLALSGGEDYELCLVARAGEIDRISTEFSTTFGVALSRVGRIERGSGVFVEAAEGRRRLTDAGFQHFGGSS